MEDKYLWLEEVNGDKAIAFAKSESENTFKKLNNYKDYENFKKRAFEIYSYKDKIATVTIDGDYVYNLWNDENAVQGIYRRMKLTDYVNNNSNWEVLIDLDQLSKTENEKWVFHGYILNDSNTRALVFLSPGGSDAHIMREFDTTTKSFVENGFSFPLSKGYAEWLNDDQIFLYRQFDEASVTTSGYARTVRLWSRGTDINLAPTIFEVNKEDMSCYVKRIDNGSKNYHIIGRVADFYNYVEWIYENGKLSLIELPTEFQDFNIVIDDLYVGQLKTNWNDFILGDLISYNLYTKKVDLVFRPEKNQSVYICQGMKNGMMAIVTEDVKSVLYHFKYEGGKFYRSKVELSQNGTLNFLSADLKSNHFFVNYSSFNQPSTYYYGENDKIVKIIKMNKSFFDHENIEVNQNFVKSNDGTMVPYFVVHKKGMSYDGKNPTILYGYGGFEISIKPNFRNDLGANWLDQGGVFVIANIRGGGEYGPAWHQAALKNNRQRAYDDFFAVAEDLIVKKITSKKHLGAEGGSNGGLLMGICYTMRPDIFSAINCMVPLLDMHRYHKLLAGASWMAEYGNPDIKEDCEYIRKVSPYQNVTAESKYPVIFINTSTKDDRVHPGHARKMAAKIKEYGHPYYYFENMEGGHGGAANFHELANLHALEMSFFWSHLV